MINEKQRAELLNKIKFTKKVTIEAMVLYKSAQFNKAIDKALIADGAWIDLEHYIKTEL